jgi:hypothetical protein
MLKEKEAPMKAPRILPVALASVLAAAAGAAFAGTAQVRFIDPDRMSDLAANKWQERENIEALTRHIQHLAARLPADQVLQVDVLDVDLAGSPVFSSRKGEYLRIMNNRADAPKIHLRWTLQAAGQTSTGEDRLTDLDYVHHELPTRRSSTPLFYEKRLLDQWFSQHFVPEKQADAR